MSVGGPSPLGTLLVQRVDAALGVTLSQQANVVSGAHPQAVAQPGQAERTEAARLQTHQNPREAIDRATQREQQGCGAIDKARLDARTAAWLTANRPADISATASAPTTLGQAARTILALLAGHPEPAPAVLGRRPLLGHQNPAQPGAAGLTTATTTGRPAVGAQGQTPSTVPMPGAAAQQPAPSATAAAPAATTPPLAGASASAQGGAPIVQTLTQALAQALQSSGLFYESHLGMLTQGKLSLEQILQEPQAQIGRNATGPQSATAPHAGQGEAAPARGPESPVPPNHPARVADASGQATGPTGNHPLHLPGSGVDPQAGMLVRQQLDALAHQAFSWRGEAWPDAPMEWQVGRHPSSQGDDAAAEPDHWATRITIHLPALGQVSAQLTLSGQEIVMHLVAPQAAPVLGDHIEALRKRYKANGLSLSRLSLGAEEANAAEAAVPDQRL